MYFIVTVDIIAYKLADHGRPSKVSKKECFILIAIGVALATGLCFCLVPISHVVCDTFQAHTLGHEGDTVLVSNSVNGFCHSEITVSQCLTKVDSFHDVQVYFVKKDNLTVRENVDNFQSVSIDQAASSSITGIVDFLYLLQTSIIEYTLCLGSEQDQQLKGTLFIFDDHEKFSNYQGSSELGEALSVFEQEFQIGNNGHSICTTVNYKARKASYYFIASRTPGGIFYSFNYTNHVRYFNQSGYPIHCTIDSKDKSCDISVSGGTENYAILATIGQNERTSYHQTHLCLTPRQMGNIRIVDGIFGSLGAIFFIVFTLSVVIWFFHCYKTNSNPASEGERQPLLPAVDLNNR